MTRQTGIPTEFQGRVYRSRLEARWAAFFDLLDWPVEYEPFDLNGWIPDFVIMGAKKQILVEIKPDDPNRPSDAVKEKILTATPWVEEDGHQHPKYEILLLGHSPIFAPLTCWPESAVGHLFDNNYGWWNCWSQAIWTKGWGFAHEENHFECRISGEYDGDHYLATSGFEYPKRCWAEAGNKVQWKAPRRPRVRPGFSHHVNR